MHHEVRTWTPKLVAETMTESLRWAALTAGRVGPRGFATTQALQWYQATEADFVAEGWGDLPQPEDEWLREVRRKYTFAEIKLFQQAIHWQHRYLYPDSREVGRVLGIWLRTKARKVAFERQAVALGYSRGHCYRMRDRGLSLIARGLHRDRVAVPTAITLSE